MLAGPVRSGWAGRLLCANLCLPCGVVLRWACGAGAEWLGRSASLRSLVSWLWGRIALCLWKRRGVAGLVGPSACCCGSVAGSTCVLLRGGRGVTGHVGLSALACVFPVGSNCIMLAGPVWLGTSASPRSLVSSLWGRIAVGLRSRRGVAGLVGLSALACVLVAGSNCAMPAEPARSGWACRPLCV